jgi:excisionase family DNA binding protein
MAASHKKTMTLRSRMLTVSEVAQLLHVHPNTVRNWSDNGLLKAYRLGYRGDRRFRLEDIDTLLTSKLV